jgi:hypothetical protein
VTSAPEFVLSGQVGDFEPELFVDGCLHRCLGVVDDVVEIAEAGDESPDVVLGELADRLRAVAAGMADVTRQRGRHGCPSQKVTVGQIRQHRHGGAAGFPEWRGTDSGMAAFGGCVPHTFATVSLRRAAASG